MIYRIYFSGK
uniref:Uncharacterized protein n=1 Tax=Rhizophora mucronata TaxID=61149 RepID=A0A2P2P189_RHIMU